MEVNVCLEDRRVTSSELDPEPTGTGNRSFGENKKPSQMIYTL